MIGFVLGLADQGHERLGELVVAIANDMWQQADLSELETVDFVAADQRR
jgi:hypothetical protein